MAFLYKLPYSSHIRKLKSMGFSGYPSTKVNGAFLVIFKEANPVLVRVRGHRKMTQKEDRVLLSLVNQEGEQKQGGNKAGVSNGIPPPYTARRRNTFL